MYAVKIAQACRRYLLLGILIPVLGVSALAYFVSKTALTRQTHHHLQSVSAVQQARVSHLIQQNQERVRLVSSRTQLRRSVRTYLHGGAPDEAVRIRQILADAAGSLPVLEGAQVLTLDGASLLGSSAGAELTGEELSRELARLGQAGEVTGRFQLESSGLREFLAGPLVLEGETLAVLLIAKSAGDYLELVGDTAGLGETGEILLLQRDAQGNALLLLPTRHDPEAGLRRVVGAETDAVCVQAGDGGGRPRLLAGSDYRGRRVLAASAEIPETGWTVLVKMDESEALAPVVRLRNLMAGAALLASLAGWLVALRLSGGFAGPIEALTRAAERISGGGASERAAPSGIEEIDTLAGAFGSMAERLVEKNRELE
ncbi:MAG: HAMP domain-containing protein, partial [Thermodesulfobacteriota bacterium]